MVIAKTEALNKFPSVHIKCVCALEDCVLETSDMGVLLLEQLLSGMH